VIRFIIKTKWRDSNSGAEGEYFKTLDVDVPELQDALSIGGYGGSGYEVAQLIGVETLKDSP
jgi:hypothetical protein